VRGEGASGTQYAMAAPVSQGRPGCGMQGQMKGIAFRVLCGGTGLGLVIIGLGFVLAYVSALAPDAAEVVPGMPMGPPALYFMAFAGCALVGWGGSLLGALRNPGSALAVTSATVAALVLSAAYRMAAWFTGDSPFPGNLPRIEAGVFLLLALAFLWLRPRRAGRGSRKQGAR